MSETCVHEWEQINPRHKRCRRCYASVVRPASTPVCSAIGCSRAGMFLGQGDKPVCDVHVAGGLFQ